MMNIKTPIILCLLLHGTAALLSQFSCVSVKDCLCSAIGPQYILECPKSSPKLNVIFSNHEVKIHCRSTQINWNNTYLPMLQGDVKLFTFTQCELPTSFATIINKVGVNNTQGLKINYSSFNMSSTYFEKLKALEKLTLNNNNIEIIDEKLFMLLNNLIEVELRSNKLKLTCNLFQYSSKLKLLDLSENELKDLPVGLLKNLSKLQILYLGNNHLTVLQYDVFKNLHSLQALDLLNNELKSLPEGIFLHLKNLRNVNLGMNKLQSIPRDLFSTNSALELINVSRNKGLTYLPNGLFSNLTHLINVLLNDCQLTKLPGNVFEGSVHLRKILLQANKLKELPEEIYKNLKELEYLDLSYNKLVHLPDNIFASLTELKILNIENNMLMVISKNVFRNLEKMEAINLKNNYIGSIDDNTFAKCIGLKEIILSKNHLNIFEDGSSMSPFNSNENLVKVDFSYNNITHIGDGWWTNGQLRELDFSHNQIASIQFLTLVGISPPFLLNVSHNSIGTVNFLSEEEIIKDAEGFGTYSSEFGKITLDLNSNPINCNCFIYNFIRYLDGYTNSNIQNLFTVITDKLLCASPENYLGFSLTTLKPNKLTCTVEELEINSSCPENCKCLWRLFDKAFIIDCAYKNLTVSPELLLPKEDIFNQTVVYLQHNLLTESPTDRTGYENVTQLYLSFNKISKLTWIPPKIETIAVDNNHLDYVSDDVLSMLNVSTLYYIYLGKNPWKCDCLDINLTDFLVSHLTTKQIDINHIKCRDTQNLLIHLTTEDLCPSYLALILFIIIILAFVALLIAIIIAVFLHKHREVRVWLYAHNMCLWFLTEEKLDKDKIYDAFISYAHGDEDFVLNELVPELEEGPQPYKLCIHTRNWLAGEFIAEQIIKSINYSKRTVVIVSSNFLKSVWGKMEFRTAHMEAMKEGRTRVIVVLYGDINISTDLDDELKAYTATHTYVKWGEQWFWDKLKYALPHLQKECNII